MVTKGDYVVRAGPQVLAVRKSWAAAQDSVQAYIRDLVKAGSMYRLTKTTTHKDGEGKSKFATYHYAAAQKGGLLTITINRGS